MQLWTTFCPGKITWELTKIASRGGSATSDWQKQQRLIANALATLRKHGIVGIRLVIFPTEVTKDGKEITWQPVGTMLELCAKQKILVDLCIGPFQYPYYPGIYLPERLRQEITEGLVTIDDNPILAEYGIAFLQKQLDTYRNDPRIHGFHFANEWPDRQGIAGREYHKAGVSQAFMIRAAELLKGQTTKPIAMNTNIDAADKKKLETSFSDILSILGEQGRLGFDIYPSQERWAKVPLQKMSRFLTPYHRSFVWSCERFIPCQTYFAEVEAQPWGNGKSWYRIITGEPNPEKSILGFTPETLQQTWKRYIAQTNVQTVSLWGSDFWLSCDAMGITWPMKSIKQLG